MQIGDKIPDYLGIDVNGKELNAKDFAGKSLIIYFYPKDNTPGCTAEACSIRDGYSELIEKGYHVIGVSKDSAVSHRKFIEKYGLPFNLIADTEHMLSEQFGVWQKKKMAGREYMGIVRTTFVIDKEGYVKKIINKVDTKNAATQLLSIINTLD